MHGDPGNRTAAEAGLTFELAEFIEGIPERRSFAKGSVIFAEEDVADYMYLIVSGQVRLSMHGEPMAMEQAGGFVGEMALIGQRKRSATATAMTDCEMAPLSKDAFLDMLRNQPEFALHVMAVLADRLRLTNEILASI